jgi:hypothetical protein
MKPKTGAQRQAAYAASGRQIACVIRDADAIKALELLERQHGGVTAAVTFALHAAASSARGTKPPH